MQRLLVVDDDEDIRSLLSLALRKHGYEVVSMEDPLAALALAATTSFDAVLLDWSMPVMDGGELCSRLRELPGLQNTPIIIVTAHADLDTRDRAAAAGATRFLTKPFSLKHLAEVVAGELRGPVT